MPAARRPKSQPPPPAPVIPSAGLHNTTEADDEELVPPELIHSTSSSSSANHSDSAPSSPRSSPPSSAFRRVFRFGKSSNTPPSPPPKTGNRLKKVKSPVGRENAPKTTGGAASPQAVHPPKPAPPSTELATPRPRKHDSNPFHFPLHPTPTSPAPSSIPQPTLPRPNDKRDATRGLLASTIAEDEALPPPKAPFIRPSSSVSSSLSSQGASSQHHGDVTIGGETPAVDRLSWVSADVPRGSPASFERDRERGRSSGRYPSSPLVPATTTTTSTSSSSSLPVAGHGPWNLWFQCTHSQPLRMHTISMMMAGSDSDEVTNQIALLQVLSIPQVLKTLLGYLSWGEFSAFANANHALRQHFEDGTASFVSARSSRRMSRAQWQGSEAGLKEIVLARFVAGYTLRPAHSGVHLDVPVSLADLDLFLQSQQTPLTRYPTRALETLSTPPSSGSVTPAPPPPPSQSQSLAQSALFARPKQQLIERERGDTSSWLGPLDFDADEALAEHQYAKAVARRRNRADVERLTLLARTHSKFVALLRLSASSSVLSVSSIEQFDWRALCSQITGSLSSSGSSFEMIGLPGRDGPIELKFPAPLAYFAPSNTVSDEHPRDPSSSSSSSSHGPLSKLPPPAMSSSRPQGSLSSQSSSTGLRRSNTMVSSASASTTATTKAARRKSMGKGQKHKTPLPPPRVGFSANTADVWYRNAMTYRSRNGTGTVVGPPERDSIYRTYHHGAATGLKRLDYAPAPDAMGEFGTRRPSMDLILTNKSSNRRESMSSGEGGRRRSSSVSHVRSPSSASGSTIIPPVPPLPRSAGATMSAPSSPPHAPSRPLPALPLSVGVESSAELDTDASASSSVTSSPVLVPTRSKIITPGTGSALDSLPESFIEGDEAPLDPPMPSSPLNYPYGQSSSSYPTLPNPHILPEAATLLAFAPVFRVFVPTSVSLSAREVSENGGGMSEAARAVLQACEDQLREAGVLGGGPSFTPYGIRTGDIVANLGYVPAMNPSANDAANESSASAWMVFDGRKLVQFDARRPILPSPPSPHPHAPIHAHANSNAMIMDAIAAGIPCPTYYTHITSLSRPPGSSANVNPVWPLAVPVHLLPHMRQPPSHSPQLLPPPEHVLAGVEFALAQTVGHVPSHRGPVRVLRYAWTARCDFRGCQDQLGLWAGEWVLEAEGTPEGRGMLERLILESAGSRIGRVMKRWEVVLEKCEGEALWLRLIV